MTPAISVEQLSVGYGDHEILKDLSLAVEEGRFIGILGPNGCGKTTLLRTLSRILEPDVGTVMIEGMNVVAYDTKAFARILGCVRQETDVAFPFTVREIVLMGRHPYAKRLSPLTDVDLLIVDEAMQKTSTLHLADKLITEISGGERQRVLIAKALAQQPKILLLDEPTSHLDINHQLEILNLMQKLTPKITVVGVFHDLNLASYFCDRLILMNAGQIMVMGSPSEVLTAERIQESFSVQMLVHTHPLTGKPYLVPVYGVVATMRGGRVHVISGGGSGSQLYHLLLLRGYLVTAGVLAANDLDAVTAVALGIEVVIEPPFAAVSNESIKRLKDLLAEADTVIIAEMPVSLGNLASLSILKDIDAPMYLLGRCDDYTGGEGFALFVELVKNGAIEVASVTDLMRLILP
ncbi:MAG: ABC transporter ATP-binding protein [Methanocalculaceae archaeon]|jgi:iron complex transport system ATP-binding protein|nr:ABC transporter ATP-binding protein [Methanocalculaceae archaeon]